MFPIHCVTRYKVYNRLKESLKTNIFRCLMFFLFLKITHPFKGLMMLWFDHSCGAKLENTKIWKKSVHDKRKSHLKSWQKVKKSLIPGLYWNWISKFLMQWRLWSKGNWTINNSILSTVAMQQITFSLSQRIKMVCFP